MRRCRSQSGRTTTSCSFAARPLHIAALVVGLSSSTGCDHDHHDAGHGHPHPAGSAAAADAAEPEPISITRWTDRYELFVEIPPLVKDLPVSYHAHVTRLADFQAVTEGRFVVRYRDSAGKVVREHAQVGVKRPGIFVFEGEGLARGQYRAEMLYEHAGVTDSWDCGVIEVLDAAPPAAPDSADTTIAFLKESQWKMSFATAWAEQREVRQQLELSGVVEPAGTDQLTIGAPTSGRFLHDGKVALAVGLKVEKGDLLGSIIPNVADEDYSRLLFAAEEAALAKKQNDTEMARVSPLVEKGILPEKRLIELKNEGEVLAARMRLARQRLGALGSGGKNGLPVKAELGGVIADVAVKNGDTVTAGAALVRIGGSSKVWVRARTFARGPFDAAEPTALRAEGNHAIDLRALGAVFLSPTPSVDPDTRVGTWLVDLGPNPGKLPPAIRTGAPVVLTARFGTPRQHVVVPVGAVVEIDTRPYVFVQVDGEHFEKRAVTVGPADLGWVPVLRGIEKGERVVTVGGFDIHLAALTGSVESHRH